MLSDNPEGSCDFLLIIGDQNVVDIKKDPLKCLDGELLVDGAEVEAAGTDFRAESCSGLGLGTAFDWPLAGLVVRFAGFDL